MSNISEVSSDVLELIDSSVLVVLREVVGFVLVVLTDDVSEGTLIVVSLAVSVSSSQYVSSSSSVEPSEELESSASKAFNLNLELELEAEGAEVIVLALAVDAVDVKLGDDDIIKLELELELELEIRLDVGILVADEELEPATAAATFALAPTLAWISAAELVLASLELLLESDESDESDELPPEMKELIESKNERPKIFLVASFLVGTFSTAALAMAE